MRVAAGIILLALGATGAVGSLLFLWSLLRSPIVIHSWAALAIVVLLIGAGTAGGGISAIRRKVYWWPLMAAIFLVIVAITSTVLIMRAPTIPGEDPASLAQRLLWSAPAWGICGLPSFLALIFLVKRKGEFQA